MVSPSHDLLRLPSSFRDPSGFVYTSGDRLLRQVNLSYQAHYDALMASGLYAALVERRWLVPHGEVTPVPSGAYRTLEPARIPYISYPSEWCFGQLKAAALLTLDIQSLALSFDMSLKDASAFNVQFIGSRPVLIDTLSFERYQPDSPWVAYRQFCEHFLGPLAMLAHRDRRLRRLLGGFIDGIPLDLVTTLLPRRTLARYGLLAHLHLHARSQRAHAAPESDARRRRRPPAVPKPRLVALMSSLRATVSGVQLAAGRTEWSHYYEQTNYSDTAMEAKAVLVRAFVDAVLQSGGVLHDLGANTGRFSRLIAGDGRYVVSHDIDEIAVQQSYETGVRHDETDVLPLVLDLTNPAPALGWALEERMSALERMEGSTVIALALVHHLAISNNVPLDRLAALFARIAKALVIEFVPKDDSQVQRLLATRADIFPDYTLEGFQRAFLPMFEIVRLEPVPGTVRTLLAMRRRARQHHAPEGQAAG